MRCHVHQENQVQAVKFTDKNAPGLSLALDEEFQAANYFTELTMGVVEPYNHFFHLQKDLLQQCGSRQPLCAHWIGRPTTISLGCGT